METGDGKIGILLRGYGSVCRRISSYGTRADIGWSRVV